MEHGKGCFGLSTRTTTHHRMSRIPRITILCCKSPIVTADLGTSLYNSSGVPMQINKRLAGLQVCRAYKNKKGWDFSRHHSYIDLRHKQTILAVGNNKIPGFWWFNLQ